MDITVKIYGDRATEGGLSFYVLVGNERVLDGTMSARLVAPIAEQLMQLALELVLTGDEK